MNVIRNARNVVFNCFWLEKFVIFYVVSIHANTEVYQLKPLYLSNAPFRLN